MVIDFHVHFSGGKYFHRTPSDPLNYLAEMDRNQIETSLLLPLDGFFADLEEDNERIIQVVQQYPERFAGLGTVSPRRTEEAVREMDRCITEPGMIGMKFHPWLQAFSPLESCFLDLAEEANARKTLFFFHDGTPPYTEPLQIAEIARRNPDLTVVMGHTGLNDLWRESLLAAQRYDNVWLCFCGCPHWGMREVTTKMGGERIVWGSDYPLANWRDTRERIQQIEHLPFSDSTKEKILYGNARQLLDRFHSSVRSKGEGQ
ncbi:MAG: amidohydrolase 2 [Paenibacillus sp.]|jgi:predicted TIM-barrel fold metal-dependent hydrolase|nr:amidohydrolase 2 [Paenibacillus sp.]